MVSLSLTKGKPYMTNPSISYSRLRDKAFRSIPPKFWAKLTATKNPDKKKKLLDVLESRLESYELAHIFKAFSPSQHKGLKSKPKKTTAQLKVCPSGSVSLTLCKTNTKPDPHPYHNTDAATYIYKSDAFNCDSGISEKNSSSSMGLAVSLTETVSNDTKRPKPQRLARGSKGLTSLAKRLIVASCKRLQSVYGRDNLAFHTATLPASESGIIRLALQKSKEILKYWRKCLSRYLESKNLDPSAIVIVMELQQRGALHLHTCFRTCRTILGDWITPYEELDDLWKQCLTAQLPEIKGKNFNFSCNTQKVKRDAGRYMAKYLSKSISKETSETQGLSITWYSVGNELKKWVKQNTQAVILELENLDFEQIKQIFENSKLVFKIQLISISGYGYRSLFGYAEWHPNLIDFLELLLI